MKIEVVVLPVSDVDRAKQFYKALGWREDADVVVDGGVRIVQVTPPGSPCSVQFGTGLTPAAPGSLPGAYLVVGDIEAARAELLERGVAVSEPYHFGERGQMPGPDPERRDYNSFVSFEDPDGNGWLVQEVARA
jgi:catechol 2,3-dioxygenase-like lactoylglutathione lyase family enzyme